MHHNLKYILPINRHSDIQQYMSSLIFSNEKVIYSIDSIQSMLFHHNECTFSISPYVRLVDTQSEVVRLIMYKSRELINH